MDTWHTPVAFSMVSRAAGLFVLTFLFWLRPTVAAQWAPTNGPEGGQINQIAVVPGSALTAYAATTGGLFKTTDAGASWSLCASGGQHVKAIAIDPSQSSTIYASDYYSGLSKSTDAGGQWTLVSQNSLDGLVFSPANPGTLFAFAWDAILQSTDGGASWTGLYGHDIVEYQITHLAFSPVAPYYGYAITSNGVLRSTDQGAHWAKIAGSPLALSSLAVDPAEPMTVYVGQAGVFKSTDGGDNWAHHPVDDAVRSVHHLLAVPDRTDVLYAATDCGVYRSSDYGASWVQTSQGLPDAVDNFHLSATEDGGIVYAGSYGLGVYQSTDEGAEWAPVNKGLTALSVQAILDVGTGTLYVGTQHGGVYRSTDHGQHWTSLNEGLGRDHRRYFRHDVSSLACDPSNPALLYAGTFEGFYRSTNGGENWIFSGTGMSSFPQIRSIVVSPADAQTLYAGGVGLYKSTNGGGNWTEIYTPAGSSDVAALAISPAAPHALFVIASRTLYRSTDGGTSWGGGNLYSNYSFTIDPSNPSVLYAGGESRILKSTNGGSTWTSVVVPGLPRFVAMNTLVVDPEGPTTGVGPEQFF